jgi:hypothetical protein
VAGSVHHRTSPRVLIVEPDGLTRAGLRDGVSTIADVQQQRHFLGARACILSRPYDFVVSNLRLGAYNGVHLVYLGAAQRLPARFIVYADHHDSGLAREVQTAGAFYETRDCLLVTLTAYLGGALPVRDRRTPGVFDRRTTVRGGRRCWDHHIGRQV